MKKDSTVPEMIVAFFTRYFLTMAVTITLGCMGGLLFSYTKGELYSSNAEVQIDKRFFSAPSLRDALPEVMPESERKESLNILLRDAISKDFIDVLGEKHDLFEEPIDGPNHADQRARLRKKIDLSISTAGTLRILAFGPSPRIAQDMVFDVINRLKTVMRQAQYKEFRAVRDALVLELNRQAQDSLSDSQIDIANRQISLLDADLKGLQEGNGDSTENRNRDSKVEQQKDQDKDPFFSDMVQKLSKLRISISVARSESGLLKVIDDASYQETAVSPDRIEYVRYGLALGLIFALLQVIYREYLRVQFYEPEEVAGVLGVRFFGELPAPPSVEWRYLIEASRLLKDQKLLDSR